MSDTPDIPVAYIWSPNLQDVADALPANRGRSSTVHGLIRALQLADFEGAEREKEGPEGVNANDEGSVTRFGIVIPAKEKIEREFSKAKAPPQPVIPHDRMARVVPPMTELATPAEMRRYHEVKYVEYLLRARNESEEDDPNADSDGRARKRQRTTMGLEHDCPPFPKLAEYARLVAASTLTACRLLVRAEARIAIVWDGGRHHALRAKASGFCYVADAVLGILLLAREGVPRGFPVETPSADAPKFITSRRRPRVMYLDLDLHFGDGVASAFTSPTHYLFPLVGKPRPPQVLTLSVHHASSVFFPPGAPSLTPKDTPHPFSLSLPLAAFAHADKYVRAWANIQKIYEAWQPDYVVLQLGVDGLPGDQIGQYGGWSVSGEGSTTWIVEKVKAWGVPTCVLGGGGYDHANTARAWALATAKLVSKDLSPDADVPDHAGIEEFAPSFTLQVPESHATDETTPEMLQEADETFSTLADRIRKILAWHT